MTLVFDAVVKNSIRDLATIQAKELKPLINQKVIVSIEVIPIDKPNAGQTQTTT